MNPITFNDKFEAAIVAKNGHADFERWASSPLFDQTFGMKESREFSDVLEARLANCEQANLPILSEHWPFPSLRVALQIEKSPEREYQKGWIREIQAMRSVHVFAAHTNGISVLYFRGLDDPDSNIFALTLRAPEGEAESMTWQGVYSTRLDGWISPGALFERVKVEGETREQFNKVCGKVLVSVLIMFDAFLRSAMAPTNHLVSVTPSKNGKSVEWRKARTHYTYITHGHPANRATVQQGERVQSDREGELVRMAHSRRAHKRTLRAARFTYARGTTIDVRATWVGPKEWMDEGGRQVYKILEPVELST